MAETTDDHTSINEKRPFDNFQETVRNLLRVPKEELDEALQKHEAQQKEAKQKERN